LKRSILQFLLAGGILGALFSSAGFAQPTISTLNPSAVTAGNPGFTLSFTGTGFCARSVVSFNGVNRGVDPGSTATTASVPITAAEVMAPGVVPVTITDPAGAGCPTTGTSTPATNFTINPALSLAPASLPGGSVGSPYVQSLSASGGTPPYSTPTIATGTIPPGTTFSAGAVSFNFTPAAATTFNFTLSMTDSGGGSTVQGYLITISQPSSATANPFSTPQSTTVTFAYEVPLQVNVKDALGLNVQGAQVTFVRPGSGPSGSFGGSNVVFTDASGNATAPQFTANTISGSFVVTASVIGTSSTPSFSLTNLPGPPATIVSFAGTPQNAAVTTNFGTLLQALVRDSFNNPVPGVSVTFTAPPSTGPSGTFVNSPVVTTGASGVAAAPTFTANTHAGSYIVTGSATVGTGTGTTNFNLTNTPGPASLVSATGGTPQSTPINTQFPTLLQVTAFDSFGNAVGASFQVTFAVPGSGASGTFSSSPVVLTNGSGVATAPALTANSTTGGPYTVTATGLGLTTPAASFSLTNTAGGPASVAATGGTPQSTTVNTAFASLLQATVKDAGGNPLSGVKVTFAATGSGASGTFAGSVNMAVTNGSGIATSAVFSANTTAGSYTVTATAAGVSTPANFSLTNTAGPPASITATAGTPQSAAINTQFATALQATVKDSFNNPVSGVSVTFLAPASGASGTFSISAPPAAGTAGVATPPAFTSGTKRAKGRDSSSNPRGASATFSGSAIVATDPTGVAIAPAFTANSVTGGYTVTVSAAGVKVPASFSLTNNPGAPFSITATGGGSQSAPIGSPFPSRLQVTVRDVGGNVVPNAQVTFGVPASGPSASFQGPTIVPTNSSGVATSPVLVANNTEGSFSATATVPGAAMPATFPLSNTAAPTALSITTTSLPTGTVGVLYGAGVGATGGSPPYTFSIASGGLPSGLTFNSGSISGTPLAPGLTPVQFQAIDSKGATASKTLTLKVVALLSITTGTILPAAVQGQGYGLPFSATGGEPPYTWSLGGGGASSPLSSKERDAVGGLPPGLNFDALTGTLSGTPSALGDFSFSVQVSDTAQRKASKSFSLTSAVSAVVPPPGTGTGPPAVQVSQTQLDFQGPTDGNTPPPQYISVVAANQQPLSATIELDSGSPGTPAPPWLNARFVSAITPARLAIVTNQVGLRAGAYKGRVLVKYGSAQTLAVNVNFTIDSTPPQLVVSPPFLRFAAINGLTGIIEQALLVSNAGTGGSLSFTASVVSDSPWVTVTPGSGTAAVNGGTPLRVIVNAQGLKIGSYLAKIRVQGPVGGSVDVPVSLFVSPNGPIIGLSATGVRFDAREGNGLTNTREITVLNSGTGTVNWKAELQTGGEGWASLTPDAGQATPNAPSKLTVAADPRMLKAGPYYALIRITDPQALNSPQFVVEALNLQPGTAPPQPDLSPAGLYFIAVSGGAVPSAQTLTVFGGSDQPTAFQAAASSDDGGAWLSIDKPGGAASMPLPGQISVSVNQANLKPGVYTGDVSVSFSSQTIRTANVTFVVLPAGTGLTASAGDKLRSAAGCSPGKLAVMSSSLVNAFSSPAGWPTPLSIRVTDDCGTPVPNSQVVVTFSNGDPPLALSLTNPAGAQFAGTWAPGKTASQMTVTVNAVSQGFPGAVSRLTGTIAPSTAPTLNSNGTVNNVTGEAGASLAPGTVVQIFGGGLTPVTSQPGLIPLPTTVNNTTVLIGAFAAPLYYLSGGQINAQIPTELQPDRQYPILVNSGLALALPDTITITQVSPGLLNFPQPADFSSIAPDSPAKAGESIHLYLVGMGATSPTVASGAAAPGAPFASASVQPVVTIGGSMAAVSFAGLTPGAVGLYQIDVDVPADAAPGDARVTVTQNGNASNTITIPVQ